MTRELAGRVAGATLAWDGDGPDPAGSVFCAVDGRLTGLEALAHELRAPWPATQEEVVAAGWRRLGAAILDVLRGEFALVLWDAERGEGLLARDRTGARPLFYRAAAGELAFASEVPALLRLLPSRPAPDPLYMAYWVAADDPPGGLTAYEGVRALRPGGWLALRGGRWQERRFWEPRYAGELDCGLEEAGERVRDALGRSVAGALSGVERGGLLLSGGLDSASVAASAHGGLTAYSATFPRDPAMDESGWIDLLTGALRLPAVGMAVHDGSVLAGAIDHLEEWQVPLAAQNSFFWRPLFERARDDGTQVMLDGEGGDLLFMAVRSLMADRIRRGRVVAATRLAARLPGMGESPRREVTRRLVREHGLHGALPPRAHEWLRHRRGTDRQVPGWLSRESGRLLAESRDPWAFKRLDGPRWWAWLAFALTAGLESVAARDQFRRRAESAGIGARHPLLAPELVDLVLRLPPGLAFDPHLGRPVLREAMKGLIPERVRMRADKSYFTSVFHRSLADDLPVIRRMLSGPGTELGAYVDLSRARSELLDADPNRLLVDRHLWATAVWRLATAECWLRWQADQAVVLGVREELKDSPVFST